MALFFLDESLPPRLTEAIRSLGYEAVHASEIGLRGAADDVIHAKAAELDAVLVTLDLDFADIRRFPGDTPIIVLRPQLGTPGSDIVEFAASRIDRHHAEIEGLSGHIMILEVWTKSSKRLGALLKVS